MHLTKLGCALILAIVPLSVRSALAAELVLVERGKANACIVVPEDCPDDIRVAATDIQSTIKRSTGVELPIVIAAQAKHPSRIILGAQPLTESLGVATPGGIDFRDERVIVKRIGQDVVVLGNDDGPFRGTQDAAIRFLNVAVGADYFYPAPHGKVVPKHQRLAVDQLDLAETPASSIRTIAMYGPRSEAEECRLMEWYRWVHNGGAEFGHQHIFDQIAPPEEYFDEHPEYYSELRGERSVDRGWQLCTTNPEVIQLAAKFVRNYFDKHPDHLGAPLSPNDGGGMCTCEACRRLDEPDPLSGGARRILTFANAVAREVAKTHPDKYVAWYAYLWTLDPPTEMQVEPNVIVVIADSDNCVFHGFGDPNCGMARDAAQRFDAWAEMTPNIKFYDYYGLFGDYAGLPFTNAERSVHNVQFLQERDGLGFHYDALFVPGPQGFHYWTGMQAMWNGDLTPETARQYYCDTMFGDASEAMQTYYKRLEAFCKAEGQHSVHVTWVVPGPLYIWNDEVVDELMGDLRTAANLVPGDSDEFQRIEDQAAFVRFAAVFVKLKQAQIAYRRGATDSNRYRYDQVRKAYLSQYDELGQRDLLCLFPRFLEEFAPENPAMERETVEVGMTPTPPTEDPLDFRDLVWVNHGGYVYNFVDENGFLAYPKSEGYFAADDQRLYVLLQLRDYHLSRLKTDAESESDGPWSDDAARVSLRVRDATYDFVVNAAGTTSESRDGNDAWSGDWIASTAQSDKLGARRWAARLEIPWSTLGVDGPPDKLGMNLMRHYAGECVTPITSWVPTFGDDNSDQSYAIIKIKQ